MLTKFSTQCPWEKWLNKKIKPKLELKRNDEDTTNLGAWGKWDMEEAIQFGKSQEKPKTRHKTYKSTHAQPLPGEQSGWVLGKNSWLLLVYSFPSVALPCPASMWWFCSPCSSLFCYVWWLPLRSLFFSNETEGEWMQLGRKVRKKWEEQREGKLYSGYIVFEKGIYV